ncbi:organic hydroperoxide resistance protein [Dyella terrae]|uniref:Organic hydroperoxide resistance protein n=3 Tax=Dyella TaxID=231454 RepID=A0A4R0Z5X1_9GAMM|nr:organic hydroperoxide resistance protein [Dyella terrae]TBR39376.1 organic hydroperoxide resistance protein [Dyella terrae]TCI13850.1 organic hydroperoxide resistance protein [Dyella soli]
MITVRKILHSGKTFTTGGRDGMSRSDDGRLDIRLSPPGAPGEGPHPEQLFAACWSACFIGALRHAAHARKIGFPPEASVEAEVDLGHGEQGFFLQARFGVSLPGIDPAIARSLIDAAHQNCPYSKATRGNVDVAFRLV